MHESKHTVAAIILAGGSGSRMQGIVDDKILTKLGEEPVINRSVRAFAECEFITDITIIYRDSTQFDALSSALRPLRKYSNKKIHWVLGGHERQDSVVNALRAQSENSDYVLIHDGARPMVSKSALTEVYNAMIQNGAAVLAHKVTDTIKRTANADQKISATLEDLQRARLWAMETPQAFEYRTILNAYETIISDGAQITDDAAAAQYMDIPITLVENTAPNPKITTPSDLAYVNWLLQEFERK